MSEESNPKPQARKAEVRTRKGFSIVWLVPLVALAIGGWLAYKSFSEKGPLITIHFKTAEGLEADKTKVKYKDVEVGRVESIELEPGLGGVVVKARMTNDTKPYLTDKTRFYVVRARIAAGEVSALGTLLSGAYIGVDPVEEGTRTKDFVGLEKPPVISTDRPGRRFTLRAENLGSLDIGSPVYFRQIKVGQVIDYDFNEAGDAINVEVFVNAPYDKRVTGATRFWNASGVDMTLNAEGIRVDTQSLLSIIQGGIAFTTPKLVAARKPAAEGAQFILYPDQQSIREREYTVKNYYLMYFDQSVRGLKPGAPVEYRGIKIGEVVDVRLVMQAEVLKAKIPVLVMIEPERMEYRRDDEVATRSEEQLKGIDAISRVRQKELIQRGLRAQLKTGNLLTGALYIDLDIFPDAPPVEVYYDGLYQVFPTVPSSMEQLADKFDRILDKVEQIPFDSIGKNLDQTLAAARSALQKLDATTVPGVNAVLKKIDEKTVPDLNQTLQQFEETLADIKATLGSGSALNYNARNALDELGSAVRSIRALSDYLDRHPEALLTGKKGDSND